MYPKLEWGAFCEAAVRPLQCMFQTLGKGFATNLSQRGGESVLSAAHTLL